MSDRFVRLFELPANLYSIGSPIIISQAVLLRDIQTESVIAQMKFQSISTKSIKALKISLSAFDITGKVLEGALDYSYLDLSIEDGQTFGSNKAIVFPNEVTRSFGICAATVIFKDGTTMDIQLPLQSLPEAMPLSSTLANNELVKQYQLSTNNLAQCVPQNVDELWECSCGRWNKQDKCTQCQANRESVFSAYDVGTLTQQMNIRLTEEANLRREKERLEENARKEREAVEKLQAQEKERRNAELAKRTKYMLSVAIPIIAVLAVVILVCSLWLFPKVIRPKQDYNAGLSLMDAGEYIEAADIFKSLGEYEDSEVLASEALYREAQFLLSSGEYENAIKIFTELDSYKDSPQKLNQVCYQFAEQLFSQEDYLAAKERYLELGDENKVNECDYAYASRLMNMTSEYGTASEVFKSLGNYKDAKDLAMECDYRVAKRHIDGGRYAEAMALLSELGDYKDCPQYVSLIEGAVSMVFHEKSNNQYMTEYYWIVSEIDTNTCSGRLIVYEGRADGKNDAIDVTYRENENMLKCWKTENGKFFMTTAGEAPTTNDGIYKVWTISGNWSSFSEKVFNSNGKELGDSGAYDSTWVRTDEDLSAAIKSSFASYFRTDGKWKQEYYIPAIAILES